MDALTRFAKLEKQFFKEWVDRDPILGTSLGLHDEYDDKLPNGSYDKLQDDARLLNRFLAEFEKLDAKKLTPVREVDLEFVMHQIRLWLFEREELRFWERVPEAPRMIGECIFQILSRTYAPLPERLRSIMQRLERLPKYIDETRSRLRAPVKLFVENELETITRLPGFFNHLKDIGRDNLPISTQRGFNRLVDNAQNAMERYSDWLIVDVLPECREEYAIGGEMFKRVLAARGIKESPGQLLSMGETEMRRLHGKLKEIARQIKRKVPVEDVREMVKQQHPETFDGVLKFVRESVGKSKQFVTRSKFAPIPDHETLYVVETPSYLRHYIPFGAYWPPARFEPKKDGYYFVTPGDCDSDKLKEHNYAALANMTVHEAYPGHHLQFASSVAHPSLVRAFADAPETAEGWAHYCEERVKEMGYDDTPPSRIIMTLDLLLRAARVIMDVKIATGKLMFQQGVEYLIDTIGMDRVAAEAEMRRYVTTPGQPLSYLYGKEKIKELKAKVKERMKARFTESFFHSAILQAGALPMNLLEHEFNWKIAEELKKPIVKEPKEEPKKQKGAEKGKVAHAKSSEGAPKGAPAPKKPEVGKRGAAKPAPAARRPAHKKPSKRKPAKVSPRRLKKKSAPKRRRR